MKTFFGVGQIILQSFAVAFGDCPLLTIQVMVILIRIWSVCVLLKGAKNLWQVKNVGASTGIHPSLQEWLLYIVEDLRYMIWNEEILP